MEVRVGDHCVGKAHCTCCGQLSGSCVFLVPFCGTIWLYHWPLLPILLIPPTSSSPAFPLFENFSLPFQEFLNCLNPPEIVLLLSTQNSSRHIHLSHCFFVLLLVKEEVVKYYHMYDNFYNHKSWFCATYLSLMEDFMDCLDKMGLYVGINISINLYHTYLMSVIPLHLKNG